MMKRLFEQRRLLISLVAGLAPGLAVWGYVRSLEKNHEERMSLVSVLVAVHDIPQGSRIHPDLFEARPVPKAYIQPLCVPRSELVDEKGMVLYENLLPIASGEQLTASKLCRIGLGGGFSWLIPEGHVAFSLDLPPEKCAGGFIEPGDFVDVLATFEVEGSHSSRSVTTTLLQNIKVMGVGDRLIGGRSLKKTSQGRQEEAFLKGPDEGSHILITVSVRPYEAAVIAHARETGSLRLVLRPVGDSKVVEMGSVDVASLVGTGVKESSRALGLKGQTTQEALETWSKSLEGLLPQKKPR